MVAELKKAVKKAEKLSSKDQKDVAQLIMDKVATKTPLPGLAEKLSGKKNKSALAMKEIIREVRIVRKKRSLGASK